MEKPIAANDDGPARIVVHQDRECGKQHASWQDGEGDVLEAKGEVEIVAVPRPKRRVVIPRHGELATERAMPQRAGRAIRHRLRRG